MGPPCSLMPRAGVLDRQPSAASSLNMANRAAAAMIGARTTAPSWRACCVARIARVHSTSVPAAPSGPKRRAARARPAGPGRNGAPASAGPVQRLRAGGASWEGPRGPRHARARARVSTMAQSAEGNSSESEQEHEALDTLQIRSSRARQPKRLPVQRTASKRRKPGGPSGPAGQAVARAQAGPGQSSLQAAPSQASAACTSCRQGRAPQTRWEPRLACQPECSRRSERAQVGSCRMAAHSSRLPRCPQRSPPAEGKAALPPELSSADRLSRVGPLPHAQFCA